jgi:hypothetical protein
MYDIEKLHEIGERISAARLDKDMMKQEILAQKA